MRILLLHHTSENTGSVAMVESVIQELSEVFENPTFVIETDYPEDTQEMFPDHEWVRKLLDVSQITYTKKTLSLEFIVKNIPFLIKTVWGLTGSAIFRYTGGLNLFGIKTLAEIKKADLVISVAGDAISQDYAYRIRFWEFEIIQALKKPFILYAQSVGPFDGDAREPARVGLNRVTSIIARDLKTIELMKEYEVKVPVHRSSDSVIQLTPNPSKRALAEAKKLAMKGKVGLVIRSLKFTEYGDSAYDDYLEGMDTLYKEIKKEGLEVQFVSSIKEDTRACENFQEKYGYDQSVLELYNFLPSEAKSMLGNLRMIISPRMHPIILSSTSGKAVPTIGLGREFKMKDYLELAGLGEYFLPMIPLDLPALLKAFKKMNSEHKKAQASLKKAIPGMMELSQKNQQLTKEIYENHNA